MRIKIPQIHVPTPLGLRTVDIFEFTPDFWFPMHIAPKDGTEIWVTTDCGEIYKAHWAEDLSGSEQPPFKGWFRQLSRDCYVSCFPVQWAPVVKDAPTGNAPAPRGVDNRDGKCLKCGATFNLRTAHVCSAKSSS